MLDAALAQHAHSLATSPKPLLIASDLDGTLAPIVRNPADASVPDETLAVLVRLQALAQVAIITGRDLETARRLVPVPDMTFVASHGLEASFASDLLPQLDREALTQTLDALTEEVRERLPDPQLHIEHKTVSVAFHYRADPALRQPLQEALKRLPTGLRLQSGKMVLEVVPDGAGKDAALDALVAKGTPHSLLVLGDDVTDIAMFRAAERHRRDGASVLIVGVAGGAEAPPAIAALADIVLPSPKEVGLFLSELASTLDLG